MTGPGTDTAALTEEAQIRRALGLFHSIAEVMRDSRSKWRFRCEFPGDVHDEVFPCHVCDRLVCGYCADVGTGSEWLCPDHMKEEGNA